jgi:hypothetical protein
VEALVELGACHGMPRAVLGGDCCRHQSTARMSDYQDKRIADLENRVQRLERSLMQFAERDQRINDGFTHVAHRLEALERASHTQLPQEIEP